KSGSGRNRRVEGGTSRRHRSMDQRSRERPEESHSAVHPRWTRCRDDGGKLDVPATLGGFLHRRSMGPARRGQDLLIGQAPARQVAVGRAYSGGWGRAHRLAAEDLQERQDIPYGAFLWKRAGRADRATPP